MTSRIERAPRKGGRPEKLDRREDEKGAWPQIKKESKRGTDERASSRRKRSKGTKPMMMNGSHQGKNGMKITGNRTEQKQKRKRLK